MATITFLPMLDCQTSRSQRPRFGEPSATTAAILCAESAVDQRLELRVVAQGGEILVLARPTGELGLAVHRGAQRGQSADRPPGERARPRIELIHVCLAV